MANKFTLQSFNDRITAAVLDASSFIKESKNWAKDLFKKGSRSGTSAMLYFNGMGSTETSDNIEGNDDSGNAAMSISSMSGDVKQYAVPLKLGNAKGKFTWTEVEERFKMGSLDEDIVKPTANALAEKIVKKVINNAYLRSTGVVVAAKDAGTGQSGSFLALASAIASLRKMRTGMTLVGHLDSDTMGYLSSLPVTSGVGHFDAVSEKLAEMYGEAAIGTFHRCPFIDEPFMPIITTGAAPGSGCRVNGQITQSDITDGADTMEIAIDGIASGVSTIKAGSAFTIANVNRCTGAGTPLLNTPYTFVVQEDATVTSNAATLKVLPVYFTGLGYIPTVSVDKIADDAVITWLTGANKTYAVGIIRAREALNWTPVEMSDIEGCKNATTTVPTMSFHSAYDGDIDDASNKGRLDVIFNGKIVDPRLVRTIYWEI